MVRSRRRRPSWYRLTINRASGEASGCPSLPFLTPAESPIANAASLVNTLVSSVLEPVRTTMARFSGPVFCRVLQKSGRHGKHRDQYRDHAGNSDDHHRGGADALRKAANVHGGHGRNLSECAHALAARESIDDVEPLRAQRRRQTADDGQQPRRSQARR